MTDFVRKKTKQPSSILTSRSYNDPVDNPIIDPSLKNGQILQRSYVNKSQPIEAIPTKKLNLGIDTSSDNILTEEPTKIRHRKRHINNTKDRSRKQNQGSRRNHNRCVIIARRCYHNTKNFVCLLKEIVCYKFYFQL